MKKYRKITSTVEALQWTGNIDMFADWLELYDLECQEDIDGGLTIDGDDFSMELAPEDWLVCHAAHPGDSGDHSDWEIVDNDEFSEEYEPV